MWPMDALYNVGLKFLTPVEQLGASDSPVRMGIIEFLPFSFESSMKQATEFMNNERRFAYTTPKSFLELIMLYTSMVGKKVDALEDQKDRLTNGLEKLRKTQLDVAELEEQLKVKAVVVKEKVDEATKFEEQVSIEKAQVDVEAAKAGTEAENANKIAVTVNKQK